VVDVGDKEGRNSGSEWEREREEGVERECVSVRGEREIKRGVLENECLRV
jgi:hypothetical protein